MTWQPQIADDVLTMWTYILNEATVNIYRYQLLEVNESEY